ncbi:MAG: hypothetical protein ABFD96_15820 [Armatimonadia bacterium]
MQTEAAVIALVAGLVLVWYLVEWVVRRERGKKLPLGQDPLRVLVVAVGRVWRQRVLLLVFVGFWVGSQLVAQLVTDPLINQPQMKRMGIERGAPTPVGQGLAELWGLVAAGDGWSEALHQSVPRLGEVLGGKWDTVVYTALYLALAMVFFRLWREQPAWLGQARRAPLGMFALLSAVMIALMFGLRWYGTRFESAQHPSMLVHYVSLGGLIVALVAMVPLTAAVWHLLLQVVRSGTCSCALAVRTGLVMWKPILWYLLLTMVPVMAVSLLARSAFYMTWVVTWWYVPAALLFVPLIVLDRRMGRWKAMGRHFDVVGDNAWDVFVFAVRLMALMLPVRLLLHMMQFRGPGWFEGVRGVLEDGVGLLMAVWVVGWFGVLGYGEERWLEGRGLVGEGRDR